MAKIFSKTIKLQVPIKEELKEIGERLASQEGLSSYQELIRYWTTQAYKGNLYINNDPMIISEKALKYKAEADKIRDEIKSGKRKGYSTIDELVNNLEKDEKTTDKA